MKDVCYFFAGGGTGGHTYPAIATAEQIIKSKPDAKTHFFVSTRSIDAQILAPTGFEYTALPVKSFSANTVFNLHHTYFFSSLTSRLPI